MNPEDGAKAARAEVDAPKFKVGDRVIDYAYGRGTGVVKSIRHIYTIDFDPLPDGRQFRDQERREDNIVAAPKLCWHCNQKPRRTGAMLCEDCMDNLREARLEASSGLGRWIPI